MTILEATEISGLAEPGYNSGAANKKYVDALSGNILSKYHQSGYGYFTYISSSTVSSNTLTTSNFTLNANTISGLIDPIYPSAATNKHYVDTISGALDAKIDALGSFDPTNYITSSNSLSIFAHSTNINDRFLASTSTRCGWAYVYDGDTVTHTCSSKPDWVSIAPSGTNPISYSFKVDDTNITIYHTSPDQESFSWRAVVGFCVEEVPG